MHTIEFQELAAVVSEFPGDHFEENRANVLEHERVVQKVFEKQLGVPTVFGTIVASNEDVQRYLEVGYAKFKNELEDVKAGVGLVSDDVERPTDTTAQILSQSAGTTAKTSLMIDALDEIRRRRYGEGADLLPAGAAKELLNFLAKAPPGSYEARETPVGSSDGEIQHLRRRLDTLFEDLNDVRELLTQQEDMDTLAAVEEQKKIKESVAGLQSLYTDGMASLEKTVRQTLSQHLDTMSSAIERFVKKVVEEAVTTQSQTLLPPATVAAEGRRELDVTEQGRSLLPGVERVLAAGALAVFSYAMCGNCGAQIMMADKFCYHCGRPNVLLAPIP